MDEDVAAVAGRLVEEARRDYGSLRIAWEGCGRPSGPLVVLEGIDGSGSTTYTWILVRVLSSLLVEGAVVSSREPTHGPVGRLVRGILRGEEPEEYKNPVFMAYLFASDRIYHLLFHELGGGGYTCRGVVGCLQGDPPAIVVLDRYKYSSAAYQTASLDGLRAPPAEWVLTLNLAAPPAHILVYLDVDPGEALDRISKSRGSLQLYERKSFLENVRSNYRRLIQTLASKGEILVESGRARQTYPESVPGPAWETLLPPCAYPDGRYPRVVEVYTGSRGTDRRESIYQAAREVVYNTIGVLLEAGMLEKA